MYKVCPKCGHDNSATATEADTSCPACGLIYEKYLRSRYHSARRARAEADTAVAATSDLPGLVVEALFYVKPRINDIEFYGRVLLFLGFIIWGLYFVTLDMQSNIIGNSFMHRVNLVFHEAGHVVFRPFGYLMTYFGGSLFQVLVPLICLGAFLWRRDTFAAAIMLWWTGQSLMDIAPYINDARARALPLLGGGTGVDAPGKHDWHNILLDMAWLEHDHAIASTVDSVGALLLLTGLAWGGVVLFRQYRNIDKHYFGF
jgi:hypothetical protein